MAVADERERINRFLAKPLDIGRYQGYEWWQLSDQEANIFQIPLADMPALVEVHQLYYDAINITATISSDRAEELRQELFWLTKDTVDLGEWLRFAKLFDIQFRSANAFHSKYEYWEIRQGLVHYADEETVE